MLRVLFVLCLSIGAFFAHNALDHEITNIKQKHSQLFAEKIEPYKVISDYNSPTGLQRDVEDNSKVYYTKEDQQILDERDRVLGPIPFLSGFSGFLSIGSAIVFFALSYVKVSDTWEEWRLKVNKKKQEAFLKTHLERVSQIDKKFLKKVEGDIKKHETAGTAMSYLEVLALRNEMNDTINNPNTKIKAEYMIKQHMRIHNPDWK